MAVLFVILVRISLHRDGFGPLGFSLVVGVFALWTWTVYDNSYTAVRPLNHQVYATFVGYTAEGSRGSSRSSTVQHRLYIVYRLDPADGGGTVVLGAGPGRVYPDRAILYKN